MVVVSADAMASVPGPTASIDEKSSSRPVTGTDQEQPSQAEAQIAAAAVESVPVQRTPSRTVPEAFEFDATIVKTGGEKLGLDISAYDGRTLLLGKVKFGPVERWNAQQEDRADTRIFRGDRIVMVNGVSGDSDELLGAARADVLNVKIRRLIEFDVSFECKAEDVLGLRFVESDGLAMIGAVDQGVAADNNELNPADLEIRAGDQVLQVNGLDVTTASTVQTFAVASVSASGSLSFRLRRPAPTTQPLK